jgi:leucyl aminopeptidase
MNTLAGGAITTLYESEEFSGKENDAAVIYPAPGFKAKRLLLVGLGESKKIDLDCFRRAMGSVSRHQAVKSSMTVAFSLGKFSRPEYYQAVVEGCLLGKYRILDWKSGEARKDKHRLTTFTALIPKRPMARSIEKAMETGAIIAEGQLLARDLSFTPSNLLTPIMLADRTKELAKKHKLSFKALDQAAIEKEKMGAYLSVTKGSTEPPRFIILEYKGTAASHKPIVLVGKGVMFDSGGISLKAGLNMQR